MHLLGNRKHRLQLETVCVGVSVMMLCVLLCVCVIRSAARPWATTAATCLS